MMKPNRNKGDYYWLVYVALNFGLLLAVMAVGLVSLFASLEIVLTIGAQVILGSMGDTVQAKYALVMLRNVWLLVGGIVLLVIVIYCINHFFKRWRDARLQPVYIKLLVIEAIILVAAQAITAM